MLRCAIRYQLKFWPQRNNKLSDLTSTLDFTSQVEGHMSQFTVDEILKQFDESACDCTFPDLGHIYYYAVDKRLHAFRDDQRWAVIVETVGYTPRATSLDDVLHIFGNCLTSGRPGFENGDFLYRIDNPYDVIDRDSGCFYRPTVPFIIRGQEITVPAEAGENICDVVRRLVPEHREVLFADEAELRRRIPADLPEILRLDEWHQREFPYEDDPPSNHEVYQQIAEVLVSGDVTRYAPTLSPNTHWSNWPESGTG